LVVSFKQLVHRDRPLTVDVVGSPEHTFSFPSGHTLFSLVLIGTLLWLLFPALSKHPAARWAATAIGAVLVVAVASSRVYLGYHWTTDVLASLLLGTAWLGTVWLIDRRLRPPART